MTTSAICYYYIVARPNVYTEYVLLLYSLLGSSYNPAVTLFFFLKICAHSERHRNRLAGIFEILTFYGNIAFPLSPVLYNGRCISVEIDIFVNVWRHGFVWYTRCTRKMTHSKNTNRYLVFIIPFTGGRTGGLGQQYAALLLLGWWSTDDSPQKIDVM